jgi:hypothetical protein
MKHSTDIDAYKIYVHSSLWGHVGAPVFMHEHLQKIEFKKLIRYIFMHGHLKKDRVQETDSVGVDINKVI